MSRRTCKIIDVHYAECGQINLISGVSGYYCSLHGESAFRAIKGKQSRFRPAQDLRVPSTQSANEGSIKVRPTHRPHLPRGLLLELISVRG